MKITVNQLYNQIYDNKKPKSNKSLQIGMFALKNKYLQYYDTLEIVWNINL